MTEIHLFYCASCDTEARFAKSEDMFCAKCTLSAARENYVKAPARRKSEEEQLEDKTESLGALLRQMADLLSPSRIKIFTVGDEHAYCWLLFFATHVRECLKVTEPSVLTFGRLRELVDLYRMHLSQQRVALVFSEGTTLHVAEEGDIKRRPEEWMQFLTSPNFPIGNLDAATVGMAGNKEKKKTSPKTQSNKAMIAQQVLAVVKKEVAKHGPPVAKAGVSKTTPAKTKVSKDSVVVSHKENAMVIPYSNKFLLQGMLLTPAELPFLSAYAGLYEEYRFTRLSAKFTTFAPTSTAGSIALAMTYGNDKDETSMTEMKEHTGTVEGPVWGGEEDKIRVSYNPGKASRKWYVTNPLSTDTPPNGNNAGVITIGVLDYAPAHLKVAVEGTPTDGSTLGYVEVDYTCEFTGPRSPAQDQNADTSAISWSGVFGVVSHLIDIFGPLLISILSEDPNTTKKDEDVTKENLDKAAVVKRVGVRGLMLRGGLNLADSQKLVDMSEQLLAHQAKREQDKADAAQTSHIESIVANYLEKQLGATEEGAPKSKIELIIENYLAKQLAGKVGDGDGFCYLLLFDDSCHEELKKELGANPPWKSLVAAGRKYPLSARLVVAEKTGEETWHIAEHEAGKMPHALLRIVETFGPFLMHCVGMPYRGYDSRAIIAGVSPWYDITQFAAVLKEVSGMSFAVKANRDNIRRKFDTLRTEAPFSVSERFPVNGLFLFKGSGDWHGKFTRLYESLDTASEPSGPVAGGRDSRAAPTSYDDAFHSFYKTLEAMNSQLLNGDGVYSRDGFETAYGLVWETRTLTDLASDLALVFQASEVRFNLDSLNSMNWPGYARTALLSEAAADLRIAAGSRLTLFSDNRTNGHRARTVIVLQADGSLGGFLHDLVATAD
jgi:hypothetical protein